MARRFAGQHRLPIGVPALTLAFDHGFVLPQKQPDGEVLALGDPLSGIGVLLKTRAFDAVADEKIVVFGHEKLRTARIALASGSAAQLIVDAAALVFVGADDVESAESRDAVAEQDVRASARHIG